MGYFKGEPFWTEAGFYHDEEKDRIDIKIVHRDVDRANLHCIGPTVIADMMYRGDVAPDGRLAAYKKSENDGQLEYVISVIRAIPIRLHQRLMLHAAKSEGTFMLLKSARTAFGGQSNLCARRVKMRYRLSHSRCRVSALKAPPAHFRKAIDVDQEEMRVESTVKIVRRRGIIGCRIEGRLPARGFLSRIDWPNLQVAVTVSPCSFPSSMLLVLAVLSPTNRQERPRIRSCSVTAPE